MLVPAEATMWAIGREETTLTAPRFKVMPNPRCTSDVPKWRDGDGDGDEDDLLVEEIKSDFDPDPDPEDIIVEPVRADDCTLCKLELKLKEPIDLSLPFASSPNLFPF